VDVSDSIVKAAQARHIGLRGTAADVRCLPFADETFDVVVSNSTLDHFETYGEIRDSLRELHRILRSGGELIVTLDNVSNPVVALRSALPFRLLHRLGIVPYYVGVSFGPGRLYFEVKEAGFDIMKTAAVMHCPRVLAVALAWFLERCAAAETQRRFLRTLMVFEVLSRWPTRFFTGYFIAVKAISR
jgi:ubiquinone/menaquinone biosynthesis C-methylase UbiE